MQIWHLAHSGPFNHSKRRQGTSSYNHNPEALLRQDGQTLEVKVYLQASIQRHKGQRTSKQLGPPQNHWHAGSCAKQEFWPGGRFASSYYNATHVDAVSTRILVHSAVLTSCFLYVSFKSLTTHFFKDSVACNVVLYDRWWVRDTAHLILELSSLLWPLQLSQKREG